MINSVHEFVIPRGSKTKRDATGQPLLSSEENVQAYVKVVTDLYKMQQSLGTTVHQHPRGKALREFLDMLKRHEFK